MANNHVAEEQQKFLDTNQYSQLSISRYERIFGRTFVSTGGEQTTRSLTEKIGLKAGQRVLDVGSGLGGSAFFMARTYGVHVLGLDLSKNMVNKANQYRDEMEETVQDLTEFKVEDVLKVELTPESFDVVYSRDAILHINNKPELFKRLLSWVKPGGKLLISDYCRGKPKGGDEFEKYVAGRGYNLLTVPAYGQLLKDAGWTNVENIDYTPEFQVILKRELKLLESIKASFIKEFSVTDYEEIEKGWSKKLCWISQNEHAWGLFIAQKPQ